jgi:hypothetical protein
MNFIKSFIYPALILSSVGYSATLTLQVESDAQQLSSKRLKFVSRQELLINHLPLQIEALKSLQGTFQANMDAQREQNPLEAFKAACSLANLQTLIASTQDVLSCIQAEDPTSVSIGTGAAPAIKQGIDQLIGYLDTAGVDCLSLKGLAESFQEITGDITNPDFPVD